MKRQLKSVLSLVLAVCFCGCTQPEVQKQEKEPMVLTFSFWEPGTAHELEDAIRNVADGYEALHPEVEIQLISQPVESYQDWICERYVADDLPDIQSNHENNLQSQYRAGLIVDITDALNKPNPYGDGELWKNTFEEKHFSSKEEYSSIPFFGLSLGIYYNKAIYEKLQLEVPATWDEFMHNCEVIEKSGILPIALMAQKEDACSWVRWFIASGLYLKKHLQNPDINANGDEMISATEANHAYASGYVNIATDTEFQEEYRTFIRYLEEYLSYCGGYPGFEESVAKAMFLSGEAAHIHTGSWDVRGLMMQEGMDFEVGAFKFPQFSKEQSVYASQADNLSEQMVAITTAVHSEEGKLQAAIDFLQYFTSPAIHQQFINETAHLPVVKGVSFAEGTEAFRADGSCLDELILRGEGHSEIVHQILRGDMPELNQAFFEKKQQRAMQTAQLANAGETMADNAQDGSEE